MRGKMGRFAPGLPKISDGQQLFVLNGLAKLANKGKMAITFADPWSGSR